MSDSAEKKKEIKTIMCHRGGWKNFLFPIPSRVSGIWWKRQWFWYGLAFKSLVCWWNGHKTKKVNYPLGNKPFDAWECDYCSERFYIEVLNAN